MPNTNSQSPDLSSKEFSVDTPSIPNTPVPPESGTQFDRIAGDPLNISRGGSGGSSSSSSDSTGAGIGKAVGSIGGSLLGGPIGGAIGGALGDVFGGLFASGGPVGTYPNDGFTGSRPLAGDKAQSFAEGGYGGGSRDDPKFDPKTYIEPPNKDYFNALALGYLTGALHQEKYGGTPDTLPDAANEIKNHIANHMNGFASGGNVGGDQALAQAALNKAMGLPENPQLGPDNTALQSNQSQQIPTNTANTVTAAAQPQPAPAMAAPTPQTQLQLTPKGFASPREQYSRAAAPYGQGFAAGGPELNGMLPDPTPDIGRGAAQPPTDTPPAQTPPGVQQTPPGATQPPSPAPAPAPQPQPTPPAAQPPQTPPGAQYQPPQTPPGVQYQPMPVHRGFAMPPNPYQPQQQPPQMPPGRMPPGAQYQPPQMPPQMPPGYQPISQMPPGAEQSPSLPPSDPNAWPSRGFINPYVGRGAQQPHPYQIGRMPSVQWGMMNRGFAEGGPNDAPLGPGQAFQGDGSVKGPGGPQDDAIPAKLSNGEFVFSQPAVQFFGVDKLAKMNEQGKQGFMQAMQQVQGNQAAPPGAPPAPQGPPQAQLAPPQPPIGQAKGGPSLTMRKNSGYMGM